MASISLNCVSSAVTGSASPRASVISRATPESALASRPCSATFAPWRAKHLAIAAPMPRELPVTSATLCLRSVMAVPPICESISDYVVPRSRTASTLNGAMATLTERAPATVGAARDFAELFAPARRRVVSGPGNVRELELALDQPPLRARSRLLTCGQFLFVQGENEAQEELLLRHEGATPMVAVHAPLCGSAAAYMDGLGASLVERPGEVQLFASPSSHATVRLRAHVKNQAFRVVIPGSLIAALAARQLLLSRLANPPTLAEVASAVGTNEFALKRQFKNVFGQPVYAYLLTVRLAQACRLLKDSADSVKEIAAAVGYAHANHFSTAFRRAYGVTPARFRAASRL